MMIMKKYIKGLLQLLLVWIVIHSLNVLILYLETGGIDFVNVLNWKPWAVIALIWFVYIYFSNRGNKD